MILAIYHATTGVGDISLPWKMVGGKIHGGFLRRAAARAVRMYEVFLLSRHGKQVFLCIFPAENVLLPSCLRRSQIDDGLRNLRIGRPRLPCQIVGISMTMTVRCVALRIS